MLVLSRKISESIVIGKDIIVTVVRISGGRVKLGINAPRSVPVNRAEVIDWNIEANSGRPRIAGSLARMPGADVRSRRVA